MPFACYKVYTLRLTASAVPTVHQIQLRAIKLHPTHTENDRLKKRSKALVAGPKRMD